MEKKIQSNIMIWLFKKLADKVKTYGPVISFLIITSIIITYPAILHLSDSLIGDGGDNYQSFSYQYIASNKIKKFQYPFTYSDVFRYPVGFNFAAGFDSVNQVIIGVLLSIFMSNITAYNLTVLILLLLNSLFSYLLFHFISKSRLIGLIGAVIYGFSFYSLARTAGHLNLISIGGFPLLIFSLLKTHNETPSRKNLSLLLLSITFIIFSSFQYALMLILLFLISFPLLLVNYPTETICFVKKIAQVIKKHYLVVLFFLILIAIPIYPFILTIIRGQFSSVDRSQALTEYRPALSDYVLPNKYLPLLLTNLTTTINSSLKSIERVVFIGWVEITLFVLSLFIKIKKKYKLIFYTEILIFFILSQGLIHVPYIPEFGRFYVLFYLAVSISIVLFLKKMRNNIPKNIVYFFLLFVLSSIIIERLPNRFWLSPIFANKNYTKFVQQQKGSAVLDFPISFYNTTFNILPYAYNKKIVSGNFQWFADIPRSRSFVTDNNLNRFICGTKDLSTYQNYNNYALRNQNSKLIHDLKSIDINTLVVHKNDLEDHAKFYFLECANTRIETSILLPHLLMPDPTEKQKIIQLFFPVISTVGDTLTFTDDGIFYLDGIHAYPIDWLPLHIFLDGREINFIQNWTDKSNKNATLDPFLQLEVKQGSKLTFNFNKNNNSDYSFVKVWYRYIPENNNKNNMSINGIKKIFEDDDAAVFRLE